MKPDFDENGLVTKPGNIRCYYFDAMTKEYVGWSDEYIPSGVSMPANATDIDPGEDVTDMVSVFSGSVWERKEDHRGKVVYQTADRMPCKITDIGPYPDGSTLKKPATPYDKWDGNKWVTDEYDQHAAAISAADIQKEQLINAAMATIGVIQLKLQAGRSLTDSEQKKLGAVLDYISEVENVDSSAAPDITWPEVAPAS